MLKKPNNPRGYTNEEIKAICKERKIKNKDFNKAFGCNTCCSDEKGNAIFYVCDVERALNQLGHKDGVYHEWD